MINIRMTLTKPLRLLVLITLALIPVTYTPAQRKVSLTWQVDKYDITASLPNDLSAGRDLEVTASLTLRNISASSFSRLTLRISENAKVASVTANGTVADFTVSQESTGGARTLQRILCSLPAVGPGQTIVVSVKYALGVTENDGLASLSPLGTQFLPFSFWYPTPTSWFFTGGSDFAPVRLTVNTNGNGVLFSAGKITGNVAEVGLNAQPFFVSGPYQSTSVEGVEVVYIGRSESGFSQARIAELASIAAKANDFVAQKLGRKLAVPLRIICVKRGSGFSDSGTILVDDAVLEREKVDAVTVQGIVEGVAKSYLGNLIRVDGDGYGVIREGLSRFLGNSFIESEFGEGVADVERLQQRTNYSAIARRDAPLGIVSPVDVYYYTATANKGSQVWSYLSRAYGQDFFSILAARADDGKLDLDEIRASFAAEKSYLDFVIDKITEMNLMIGLPQRSAGQFKSALRNIGGADSVDAKVVVTATTSSGKKITANTTIPANAFGEVVFPTSEEVVRVEVDSEKAYPQVDYSDDIAPRVIDDPDPLLFIKREFDRQKFPEAEKNANAVLGIFPEYHDARILLARSLLAQNKITEAGRQFDRVLSSSLPSPQSIAWAELGLGEIAQKTGQASEARRRFTRAISADSDYGATLGAVRALITSKSGGGPDEGVRGFFAQFDRAVVSNSKAEVQVLIAGGEVSRFASNVAGQAQQWATNIEFVQPIDSIDVLVATSVELRLLNREVESGVAVFRLTRVGSALKLSAVEIFEVG